MKLNITKLLFVPVLVLSVFFVPEQVYANAPDFYGVVKDRATGAPIPGVWVKLQTIPCRGGYSCPECLSPATHRYEMTDINGRFYFDHVDAVSACTDSRVGRSLDTDLDGTGDDVMMEPAPPGCYYDSLGIDPPPLACGMIYGCSKSPYTFSVVTPFNWSGAFDATSIRFSNADNDYDIGTLYFNGTQKSGPTPTPNSSGQTFTYEPPFPSCITIPTLTFGGGDTDLCRYDYGSCLTSDSYNFSSVGGSGSIKLYTGAGHRWDLDCNIGPDNDPTKSKALGLGDCDDVSQNFEALRVILNGVEIGQTTDMGTDINSYWEFPATLAVGTNTLELRHVIANQNISIEAESVFYKGVVCDTTSGLPVTPPPSVSCTLDLPEPLNIQVGTPQSIPLTITENNGTIDEVTFSLLNASSLSVCSSALSSCPAGKASYTDDIRGDGLTGQYQGFSVGSTTLSVTGRMIDEGVSCNIAIAGVNVTDVSSWWQVKEGDVTTNGDIKSPIPISCVPANNCDPSFIIHDTENFPGIPAIGGGYFSGNVSSTGWFALGSDFVGSIPYNFDYFERRTRDIYTPNIVTPSIDQGVLSSSIIPVEEDGYYYFFYDGSVGNTLTISGDIDLGSRNVVLIVNNASVRIEGDIRVADGLGFFMLISERDIIVDSEIGGTGSLPHLEGLYYAENNFLTESDAAGDTELRIRGAVSSDNITLGRDLINNSYSPAEFFEYGPDLYMRYPTRLSQPKITWKEIVP